MNSKSDRWTWSTTRGGWIVPIWLDGGSDLYDQTEMFVDTPYTANEKKDSNEDGEEGDKDGLTKDI